MKRTISIIMTAILLCSMFVINSFAAFFPTKYSSIEKGYVTPVKEQGIAGTCWAFSTISCLETDAIMKGYETVKTADFSEAYLVWSLFTASGLEYDINKDEKQIAVGNIYTQGMDMSQVYPSLAEAGGIKYEAQYPFNYSNLNAMGNYDTANYYNNIGYTIDKAVKLSNADNAKSWILKHGAVAATVKYNSTHSSPECSYCRDTVADHSITIVGWDDNFNKNYFYKNGKGPQNNGAWLCKNSYGTDWGDNGYFWLSFEDCSVKYFGFSIAKVAFNSIYSYNGTGYTYLYYAENMMCEANIFNVKEDTKATSVSFVVCTPNVYANVKLVKLNDNYTSPIDGTVVAETNVAVTNEGFYRVNIDKDITKGNYAVVIKVTGNTTIYLPAESNNVNYNVFTASAGQSFFSTNGKYWDDTVETYQNCGNAIINLYTFSETTVINDPVPEYKPNTDSEEDLITGNNEPTNEEPTNTEEPAGEGQETPNVLDTPNVPTPGANNNTQNGFFAFLSNFFATIGTFFANIIAFFSNLF